MITKFEATKNTIAIMKELGFNAFLRIGLKYKFIEAEDIDTFTQELLDELISEEEYEDCAFLIEQIKHFQFINKNKSIN